MALKVIIAGGRDFKDYSVLLQAIANSGFEITEVVSGHAPGADRLGERYANDNKIQLTLFPADWYNNGKAAGAIRNRQMAHYADALIALPGGPGTRNMVEQAKRYGLAVFTAF